MRYLGLLGFFVRCFGAGTFSWLSIFTDWAASWEKYHWAEKTTLVFLPLLQEGDFHPVCWEIRGKNKGYCSLLEAPLNARWSHSQFRLSQPLWHPTTKPAEELDVQPGGNTLPEAICWEKANRLSGLPWVGVSPGHWRPWPSAAHLGALLRIQDEKRHGAIRLIFSFSQSTIFEGDLFSSQILYQISTISEHGRAVNFGLRF